MALKLSVKIGDVTNLSDARYAAGMGVEYIGFNIDSTSKNFVTSSIFKEIVNWVSGVGIIGEIGMQKPDNQEDYPTYLTETTNLTLTNNECVLRIDGKGASTSDIEKLLKEKSNVLFFVLELTTEQIENNLAFFAQICTNNTIYISTEFNEQLLEKIVTTVKPTGIEIKGGLEDQAGFKDYDGIADVLEWLEEDE